MEQSRTRADLTPEPSPNQGIERTAAILRALGRASRAGAKLTDVAHATGLSKSTVHRLLAGLAQVGLVEQDEDTGLFHLGFDLFALGAAAANRYGIADIAAESMARLAARTEDTVFLSVRSGTEAICVDRHEGSYPIKVLTLRVGDRRPLGVGAGSLALLAQFPDAEVERVIEANGPRLQAYPSFSPARLYELVETTRRQGYSFNDGLVIPEMYALGVAVRGRKGRPIAAISIAAIAGRMQADRRRNLVEWLTAEAARLEARIGALTENLTDREALRLTDPEHRRALGAASVVPLRAGRE